ncbi:MAG: type IX secretion system membrane protein PorP/SprF [Bacteroidetes bacterium]|nr:type IX secretion system membrane protein PorP/SprF [Bacteroidota bacterium]
MFSICIIKSQQMQQFSQYMLNELQINPASAGKDEYADVRSNNRYQWSGITDAPRTYYLSCHGPITKKHMGLGMNLYTDIVGPTRRVGLDVCYAYHMQVKKDVFLSMGISAGILQWGIDGSKITLHDQGDPSLMNTYQTAYVPNFGAGIYFHKKDKFYFGFSAPQLYQSPIPLYTTGQNNSNLVTHFNLNGAYKFAIDDDFKIEPAFLVKYAFPAPPEIDLNIRALYKESFWIGGGYRVKDAFTVMVGYMYQNFLMLGYSYDITTSNIRKYSSGTHEILLGLRFSRKQAPTWNGKE